METASTDIAELCFDRSAAILYVKIKKDVHIDLRKTIEHFKIIKALTNGERHYAIIDGSCYFSADDDALAYAALDSVTDERIACTFYSLHLANRLTIHFFKLLQKPTYPLIIYRTKEDALSGIVEAQKNRLAS